MNLMNENFCTQTMSKETKNKQFLLINKNESFPELPELQKQ
jgi:hypothetical protein